jgi:hypothetical protein
MTTATLPPPPTLAELEAYSLPALIAFVDERMPGYQWLVRSNHARGVLVGYFANVVKDEAVLSHMTERYPVYGKTPTGALAEAIYSCLSAHCANAA